MLYLVCILSVTEKENGFFQILEKEYCTVKEFKRVRDKNPSPYLWLFSSFILIFLSSICQLFFIFFLPFTFFFPNEFLKITYICTLWNCYSKKSSICIKLGLKKTWKMRREKAFWSIHHFSTFLLNLSVSFSTLTLYSPPFPFILHHILPICSLQPQLKNLSRTLPFPSSLPLRST